MQETMNNVSFDGMGIAPEILEMLDNLKFEHPTPIQHKAIPVAVDGADVIGVAQTGTGKTLAFTIPVVQRLSQKKGQCLVVVPTRELAYQVNETFKKITKLVHMNTSVVIGGVSISPQIKALRQNPEIIVGTPGRLLDHMKRKTLKLDKVQALILDEADRMLDMGFKPDIERIIRSLPKKRQTMLFSATIPREIVEMGTTHMKLPVHIEVAPSGTTAENIDQEIFIVQKRSKFKLLAKLLEQHRGSVLLFTRTKRAASRIKQRLKKIHQKAAEMHSDRTLRQRREALKGFKNGKYRILVATDIAARGIDVIGIETVINYDLPDDTQNYVHRVGRTGRAGHTGRAISFATPDQGNNVKNIENLIKTVLPVSEHPELPKEKFVEGRSSRKKGGYGRSHKKRRKR